VSDANGRRPRGFEDEDDDEDEHDRTR